MQTLFRALRSLRRSPAVSAVVVLSIGSALGLSTSLLAVIDSITHPVVPFSEANRLYTIFPNANRPGPTALEQLETLRALDGIESASASYPTIYRVKVNNRFVQDVGFTSRTAIGFFEMLGARPRLGRLPDEQEIANERAVLVSDELWRRAFNNRESIGDATVEMSGHSAAMRTLRANPVDVLRAV
jgi:MacB-like protein